MSNAVIGTRSGKYVAEVIPLPKRGDHPWYRFGPILSHNARYNVIAGGRGIGKTYGAKRLAIKDAINKGEEFILMRRYKEELMEAKMAFFADIQHEFPEWDLEAYGNHFRMAPSSTRDEKKRKWKIIGYAVALSTAQRYKGVSYARVTKIIFDEFIIEKGNTRYLTNEVTAFNNFYVTVDRFADRVTVFFLANAVSITNPYFIEWGIIPEAETFMRFKKVIDPATGAKRYFIVAHFPDSADFAESVRATMFGQFVSGTDYEDYAINNKFSDNTQQFVKVKDKEATYVYTLEARLATMSVWYDATNNEWHVLSRIPNSNKTYTLLPERMAEGKTLVTYTSELMKMLRHSYSHGSMYFDNPATRNAFLDVFNRK